MSLSVRLPSVKCSTVKQHFAPRCKADGVRVGVSRGDDALVVFQPLDGAQPVAQRRRIFKPQRLGRGLHLLGQLSGQLRSAPVKDHLRLADGLADTAARVTSFRQ